MRLSNKHISIILSVISVFISLDSIAGITKETVDSVTLYFAGGEYNKCISLAKDYEKQSPKDLYEKELITKVKAYGAMSLNAMLFEYQELSKEDRIKMILWGMDSCNFFDWWLKSRLKNSAFTLEYSYEYFINLDIALSSYAVIADEMDGITKEFDKMCSKWVKNTHNKFYKTREQWSDHPALKLMILKNALLFFDDKYNGLHKLPSNIVPEYWDAIDELVTLADSIQNDNYVTVIANIYVKQLYEIFKNDIHSKKPNYDLSLDVMLKSRDFILYSKGGKQYRDFKNTSWHKIKSQLADGEYCMEHFESHTASGMFYATWDRTTRKRNYAFVFNNKMVKPDIWHRGYIDKIEQQGFERVIESYPDCKKVYATGSDYMALKDFAGNNPMVHRCHSLSQIKRIDDSSSFTDFSFVGCINYSDTSDSLDNPKTKGLTRTNQYKSFSTDESLYTQLKGLGIDNFNQLIQNNVNIDNFKSLLGISKIVHISTHGIFDNTGLSRMNDELDEDVVNGNNILKNCKLILSGYNNDNSQYISGEDIRSLDLSNIDLLFLDACQTGDGRRITLGSYSLAEAFHLAGVRNIIAILDPIDPNTTHDFSIKFYGLLKHGNTIHDAFYRAKKEICPDERLILWE